MNRDREHEARIVHAYDVGTYRVSFKVHTTEPGQFQRELDGADLAETTSPDMNPTSWWTFDRRRRDHHDRHPERRPLTITPADGASTHANARAITIERLA